MKSLAFASRPSEYVAAPSRPSERSGARASSVPSRAPQLVAGVVGPLAGAVGEVLLVRVVAQARQELLEEVVVLAHGRGSSRSMRRASAASSRKLTLVSGCAAVNASSRCAMSFWPSWLVKWISYVVVAAGGDDRLERRRLRVAVAPVGRDHVVGRGQALEEVVVDVADRAVVGELEDVERERAAGRQLARLLQPLEHLVAARVAAQQHPLAARLDEHDDAREVEDRVVVVAGGLRPPRGGG